MQLWDSMCCPRQPSTVWCSRERLPAAAAQPAMVRQSCSATDFYLMCHYQYRCRTAVPLRTVTKKITYVNRATKPGRLSSCGLLIPFFQSCGFYCGFVFVAEGIFLFAREIKCCCLLRWSPSILCWLPCRPAAVANKTRALCG
jgi:hypothetical protein